MNVTISGRHMNVTDSMKAYAREKAERLQRYFDQIQKIEVVMNMEGERHLAEMIVTARVGGRFISQVQDADMYAAIDALVAKMERQMKKQKEKIKKKRKPRKEESIAQIQESAAREMEPEREETYEDVIENMELK